MENEILSRFLQLDDQTKVRVLLRIALEASIYARDTYAVGTLDVKKPNKLREYNELINKIISQTYKYSLSSEERYPDDVFISLLLEMFKEIGSDGHFKELLKREIDV